jgi:hypothetical protein
LPSAEDEGIFDAPNRLPHPGFLPRGEEEIVEDERVFRVYE